MGFELLSSCLPDIRTQKRVGDLWPRESLQLTSLCNTPYLHTVWSSYSTAHIANNSCFRSDKHTCISQLPCLPSSFSCKRILQSSSIGNEHLLILKFHSKVRKRQWGMAREHGQPTPCKWSTSINPVCCQLRFTLGFTRLRRWLDWTEE